MKVVVVGAGAREHALAKCLAEGGAQVLVSPGNPGVALSGEQGASIRCVGSAPEEIDADLFVIGPEPPLVEGLADRLRSRGAMVVGPGVQGARLEASKAFMKGLATEAGVPTASYSVHDGMDSALGALRSMSPPYVVKTDGLAGGKGVLVTSSLAEAEADVIAKLSGKAFGSAGSVVLIEEALSGPEMSVLALCDGTSAVPFPAARDAKRLLDGDNGPNTGGMGAYAPVDGAHEVVEAVMDRVVEPVLWALRSQGVDYRGVLYAGVMCTAEGPKLVEFNVRMGDPEAQVILPLVEPVSVLEAFTEAAAGKLGGTLRLRDRAAVCVVLAAEGYPSGSSQSWPVSGLEAAGDIEGVDVLHAGTSFDSEGRLVSGTGRVLDVVARGESVREARERAYLAVEHLSWPGMQYRRDIALGVSL